MEIAKFTKRVFSYLCDLILCFAIGASCGVPLFLLTSIPWYFNVLITLACCYGSYLIPCIIFMSIVRGRTLGALIFGIKHVNNDGSKISIKNIIIKNLYLGLIPFTIVNAFYMLSVHTERTIFDKITDTIVIDIFKSN